MAAEEVFIAAQSQAVIIFFIAWRAIFLFLEAHGGH